MTAGQPVVPASASSTSALADLPAKSNGNGHHNGNGHRPPFMLAQKAASTSLLPRLNGAEIDFFSPDGGKTILPASRLGPTALAFVAYWYVATRWRAQKIAEAPLMVVAEDQQNGSEEWLADHELAPLLDAPSPDYDMGELLERSSRYLDNGGECLWVIDRDRTDTPARLTPFRRGEFTVRQTADRLYGEFVITTARGPEPKRPEQVCYFRDDAGETWGSAPRSRLDAAVAWLRLGEEARQTIRDALENGVWPSLLVQFDPEWNPDDDEWERVKQELNAYAQPGNRFKAQGLQGGGSAQQLGARLRDMVPDEILNRVESVVAAVSGVPAIVLQFQVGMENSPWSQMEQARRMAYDDCVQPAWRKLERVLTRQLLRLDDPDPTHFVRFDTSNIAALQLDREKAAAAAVAMGDAASVNERRMVMGLEPATPKQDPDGRADEIPELQPAPPAPIPFAPDATTQDGTAASGASGGKRGPGPDSKLANKRHGVLALHAALRAESRGQWESHALVLLQKDATEIERVVRTTLVRKSSPPRIVAKASEREIVELVMADVRAYLHASAFEWQKIAQQLARQGAERATAVIAADLGITYNQLHAAVVDFAKREAAALITHISDTTRETVADVIVKGLEAGKPVEAIARDVGESGAFAPSRATMIAQTESTKAYAGGPVKALQAFAKSTGRTFTKRWAGVLDDRERDSHISLEGETQFIERAFSNGLQFPGDPSGDPEEIVNCRCALVLSEVADE